MNQADLKSIPSVVSSGYTSLGSEAPCAARAVDAAEKRSFDVGGINGRSILVVEDSDDMWRLTEHFLKRAGALPQRAINGLEAVKKANEFDFEAIIMDVQMPVMDGLEATRVLRAKGYLRPIIAVTTNSFADHSQESIDAGCNEHITKPANAQSLVAKLAEYCDSIDLEMTLGSAF